MRDSAMTRIGAAGDGTQIWKITHNGVDTHPIHWHLFNVQLINRVAWDGALLLPDANELGWKETLRINPLEDTIIAMRPASPTQPFDIPNSIRPIDPTMPLGVPLKGGPGGFIAPDLTAVIVVNKLVNYGGEYMWHCHILSHEEMDMMHAMPFATTPNAPSTLIAAGAAGRSTDIVLSWIDNSANETDFTIERATAAAGPWTALATLTSTTTGPTKGTTVSYTDTTAGAVSTYFYRVSASNTIGDPTAYVGSAGFPTLTLDSGFSNIATLLGAPTNLTATLLAATQVRLTWIDTATNETGFVLQRSTNGGAYSQIAAPGAKTNTGTVTYTDTTVAAGNIYQYRVAAVIASIGASSAYALSAPLSTAVPAAPSGLSASAARQGTTDRVTLTWGDASNNETGFTVQRATNTAFTAGLTATAIGPNTTTFQAGSLPRGTNYYFRIRSYNIVGTSGWVNATPFPILTP
jgi:hypothetical protein